MKYLKYLQSKIQYINGLILSVLAYLSWWYHDKNETMNMIPTFEWKYLILATIVFVVTIFFFWSVRQVVISSLRNTVKDIDEQRWRFICDAIVPKLYPEKGDILKALVKEVRHIHPLTGEEDTRGEFKYDDEFIKSLGLPEEEIRLLKELTATTNTLSPLIRTLVGIAHSVKRQNKKNESNPDSGEVSK